jgi:hypothetical protein
MNFIFQKNERQALTDRLINNSQVCVSIGIIRACGLKVRFALYPSSLCISLE